MASKSGSRGQTSSGASGDAQHESMDGWTCVSYLLLPDESGSEAVEDLVNVIKKLRVKQYHYLDEVSPFEEKCRHYFEKDYRCEVVQNKFCASYPSSLIIPVAVKEDGCDEGSAVDFNSELYTNLIREAVHARLLSRFVAPVILFDNKFICRAATLGNKNSVAFNQSLEATSPETPTEPVSYFGFGMETMMHAGKCLTSGIATLTGLSDISKLLENDAEVLKHLKVNRIFDLMVEYSKLYREFISVGSSEIKHGDIYGNFKIEGMPFPGCECFVLYSKLGRDTTLLKCEWSEGHMKRVLKLSDDLKNIPDLDVSKMKDWYLVELAKNYLRIILTCLVRDKSSIFIHCVTGRDRTSVFTSLLRLSLWADKVIHRSLKPDEMAYLTVTYDWFLFGHPFPERWNNKEEIMHFCFNFLSHIANDHFSITKMFKQLPAKERENRQFPDYVPGRRERLERVKKYVLDAYREHIVLWDYNKA